MSKMNLKSPDTILMVLLAVTLGIQFFAGVIDTVLNSLTTLSGKDMPLASLFSSSGVVALLIVASFIILLVKGVSHKK